MVREVREGPPAHAVPGDKIPASFGGEAARRRRGREGPLGLSKK